MNTQKTVTRIVALILVVLVLVLALKALNRSVAFYYSPSEVHAGTVPKNQIFRIGGLVRAGSLKRETESLHWRFVLADAQKEIEVRFTGILPDLFQAGRGAVVQGQLTQGGVFLASEVLAKHDENYLPPEAPHSDQAPAQQ